MKIIRTYSDSEAKEEAKEGLRNEDKLKILKRGISSGGTLTGLGITSYGVGKLGNFVNTGKIDKDLSNKLIGKRVQKEVNRLKKQGVKTIDESLIRKNIVKGLNETFPVSPESIRGAKKAGKFLMAAGVPVLAYSMYKHKRLKKEVEADKRKGNENDSAKK